MINRIDINRIVVSSKLLFGKQDFQYFIGCKDKKIIPLCRFFPEISMYKKYFDKTECMYFKIKEENVFDKSMKIWEKVSNIIQKNI